MTFPFLRMRPPPVSTLFPYTTLFRSEPRDSVAARVAAGAPVAAGTLRIIAPDTSPPRSEEHTSELQSQSNLVCRLLLEKKKTYGRPWFGSILNLPSS